MTNKCDILQQVLRMDFTQMRVLNAESGNRATDEAITFFVTCFNEFFEQFATSGPTQEELKEYQEIMKSITEEINRCEHLYFIQKHHDIATGTSDDVHSIVSAFALKSYVDIPKRMQFWAAGEKWGDTIRNPAMHRNVVHQMDRWNQFNVQHSSVPGSFYYRTGSGAALDDRTIECRLLY